MTANAAEPPAPFPPDPAPEEAASLIRSRTDVVPSVALILGSGLGDAVDADVEVDAEFPYASLPGFPSTSVPGHAGVLRVGRLRGVPAAVFRGRVHHYEGHGIGATTLIPRLARHLGVTTLIVTNAAGGLTARHPAGTLMLIDDHINLIGVNPLTAWRYPSGMPAFVDLGEVYDRALIEACERVARERGVALGRGVYVAVPGPTYETPAEIRFLAGTGAAAVGMSTVPEAVAARALGMRVLGISCITNVAVRDVAAGHVMHEDVLTAATRASGSLRTLLEGLLPELAAGVTTDGGGTEWTVT